MPEYKHLQLDFLNHHTKFPYKFFLSHFVGILNKGILVIKRS